MPMPISNSQGSVSVREKDDQIATVAARLDSKS